MFGEYLSVPKPIQLHNCFTNTMFDTWHSMIKQADCKKEMIHRITFITEKLTFLVYLKKGSYNGK